MRNSSNSMLRWFADLAELGMPKLVKAAFDKTRVSKIAKLHGVSSLRADWKTLSYMLFGAVNDLPGKFCQLMFFFGLEIRTRLSELMSCANVGGPLFGNCFRFFLQYSDRERAQTWLASPGNSSNSCFWRWDKIKREKSRLARTRLHSQHPCHVRYSLESTLKSTTRHIYKSGGSLCVCCLICLLL